MSEILIAIDIGSSKVSVAIAVKDSHGCLEILGTGLSECSGVKKGAITDCDAVTNALQTAVLNAESTCGLKTESAFVTISSMQTSILCNTYTEVFDQPKQISHSHIKKLMNKCREVKISEDVQIIDVIPRKFILDEINIVKDPIGKEVNKIELDAEIICANKIFINNITRCFEKANIKINGIILESYALDQLATKFDIKDNIKVIIDVGGSITNVIVIENEELIFFGSVPVGGESITNDLSIGLKISKAEAEKLKRKFGQILSSLEKIEEDIEVTLLDGETIEKIKPEHIYNIIYARVQEIIMLSKKILDESEMIQDDDNIILFGAGISYIDSCADISRRIFNNRVTVPLYKGMDITKPEYGCVIGALEYILINVMFEKSKNKFKKIKNKEGFLKKMLKLLGVV